MNMLQGKTHYYLLAGLIFAGRKLIYKGLHFGVLSILNNLRIKDNK